MSAAKVRVSADEVNPNSTNLPTRSPVEEHSFAADARTRAHIQDNNKLKRNRIEQQETKFSSTKGAYRA